MKYKIFATFLFMSFFLVNGAYAQNKYYLSQIANGNFGGGSYKTTFILFNNTDTAAVASLDLTDDFGNPLALTLGEGYGNDSSFRIDLAPGAIQIIQTDGLGTVATGAATVTCGTSIGVSAIFSIYDSGGNYVTETGVGSSDPLSTFVLPVDTTGLFNTGLALFNPSGGAVSITMSLRDKTGQLVGAPLVLTPTLTSHGHIARFIAGPGQLFPSLTGFQGTLLVQCSAPVAVTVLRQNSSPLSFTSLPGVPTSSTQKTLRLAQVANGSFGTGSYKTSFLIFNFSASPATGTLALTKDNGSPFSVTIPGYGTNSSFNFNNLAPGASLFLQTDGAGAVASGAATITSNVPIGASGVFTVLNSQGAFQTETGVGDSPVLTALTLPVEITPSFDTGVAFFTPGGSGATLTFRLLDEDGAAVGSSVTRPLLGNGQLAVFVSELFPGTSNFRGSLAVTSTAGVAALTLRQNRSPLSFTSLPVVSGVATGTPPTAALLPQTETGITATSNLTKNKILPSGFRLTGTVGGPGQAVGVIASAGQTNVYSGGVNPLTGKYLIVLPAGTYNLTATFVPGAVPQGTELNVISSVLASVTVSADATKDLTLPQTSLFTVSGTVNGLSNLTSATNLQISFTSANGTTADMNLAANGSYQGVLPAGAYTAGLSASISFPPSLFQNQSLGIFDLGSANISGNTTIPAFTAPATAKLSGKINGGGSPLVGASVQATGPSESVTSSAAADMLTAQYQMILPKSRTYAVNLSLLLMQGTTFLGTISYPVPGSSLSLSQDTANYDFTVPSLPVKVTISGRVTDSSGNPASGVFISAISQSLTGVPNLYFATSAQTDAGGNYSMVVFSGTNYQLVFYPMPPSQ